MRSPGQQEVLAFIRKYERVTFSLIQAKLKISQSAASRQVKALNKFGFVDIVMDGKRRFIMLSPTEKDKIEGVEIYGINKR